MAPLSKTLALAGALFAALGSAAPVDKRETDIVYETVTSVVWTTVDVTTTIYGNAPATATPTVDSQVQAPGNSQPEQSVNYKPHSTSTSTSTSTTVWWTPSPETWATSASTSTSTSTTVWWTAPSSSSTTEAQWTPSTTTVPAAATTTSAAATTSAASSSSSSSSSSGYSGSCSGSTPCTGDLTYYVAGLGSCGKYSDGSTDKVVALPVGIMKDSDCGKTVHITYNGVTMEGTVWDKCMGCDDVSIDLSEKLFGYFGTEAEGRLTGAKWYIE